jgi:DNA-binding protein HU-beta
MRRFVMALPLGRWIPLVSVKDWWQEFGEARFVCALGVRQNRADNRRNHMSKAVLAAAIKDTTNCTVAQAGDAVDSLVKTIAKMMKKDGSFNLAGFGTFKRGKRAARTGRNPKTGEPIAIKASKTVRFKPSSKLKGMV